MRTFGRDEALNATALEVGFAIDGLVDMSNRRERIMDWLHDGCVLFDKRLDCVYANHAGSALFGLTPDELVGRSLHSQFPATIA